MISANALSKRFGSTRALDKVSFEVRRGEVVGFLGPNGAGKSTTMRILTCYISPTTGTAKVHGHDVFDDPLAVRQTLGYLPQRAPLYTDMNVYEYLQFAAQIRGLDEGTFKNRLKKVVEVCGLGQSLGKTISTLSHGYRQRVGLGQALIHDPPILILDEPTSDLDPNEKAEVLKYIKEIGKDRTILLSTHNLGEVEEACARAIIVSKGRVVADGPLDDIRAKTGRVRYILTVDETRAEAGNKPPKAIEIEEALGRLDGASAIRELPTDETAHKFELSGAQDSDLRAEIFRLVVAKNWTLLELRRDAQSLDAVFRDLTRGDERLDRGGDWEDEDEDESDEDDSEEEESEEEESEEEESDEDDSEEEESDEDDSEEEESDEDDEDEDEDDEEEPSERKKK
ncbi:MAG: ATP-binding cassette domain-containing protein [Polyangiaceae bacterium]|nr:ATP-binding cassette domain-containing protein [Polyangiaceae bacterium]MCE7890549.1 ATP-binding cassette domain-containing protein [Sorangiineae bacterium PRO1]MCL4753351.1 ATP-binding cassette domain-containing protein [Myxococcales bacterium]